MASTKSGSFRGPCMAINGLGDQYHQAYHSHSVRHPPIGGRRPGTWSPAGVRRAQAAGANAGSERDSNATLRRPGAALVGHHHALDRAEHGHVPSRAIVEAESGDGTDRATAAGRDKGQVLAEQHCVHGRVTGALKRDDAAMDVGLQLAARCEIAKPSAMIFPELRIVPPVPI